MKGNPQPTGPSLKAKVSFWLTVFLVGAVLTALLLISIDHGEEALREYRALPTAPVREMHWQGVQLRYQVITIEGAEYILVVDERGAQISLCPKVQHGPD